MADVESIAYALLNGSWSTHKKAVGAATLLADKTEHAERVAYAGLPQTLKSAQTYCFVTNAFPCSNCLNFFLTQTKQQNALRFVLRCTANETGDGAPFFNANGWKKTRQGTLYISQETLYMAGRSISCTQSIKNNKHVSDQHGSNDYSITINTPIGTPPALPAAVTNGIPALPA